VDVAGVRFELPDGRLMHPNEVVVNLLRQAERWIAQYQLTQETRGRVVLRIAPLHPPPAEEVAAMVAYLAGPEAGFVTGASLTIDGGFTAQ
jgi:NAD(P)-dependent dehydrogenase (short-subunit alcohol dehydrogenase family)